MTAWMDIAEGELGQAEVPGAGDNPRIREYHASASDGQEMADSVPWCASFAGWVLSEAGITGTGNRMARSYLNWGDRLDMPRYGCVVVLTRSGAGPGAGHVGFFHSRKNGRVFLLGGNQGDKVSIQGFPESQVLGYRWPKESAAPAPTSEEHSEASKELQETSWSYWLNRIGLKNLKYPALGLLAFLQEHMIEIAVAVVIGVIVFNLWLTHKRQVLLTPVK